jgi:CheY-like chemotaxis protein
MQPIPSRRVCLSADPAPAIAPRTADVLFVSPDPELCAVIMRVLGGGRYRVQTALHSGHALLAGFTSRIDVLVSELCMPDLSGPALAERLRRHHPNLQAIYLANPGSPEGIENVLVRPFTRDDLTTRLDDACRSLTGR